MYAQAPRLSSPIRLRIEPRGPILCPFARGIAKIHLDHHGRQVSRLLRSPEQPHPRLRRGPIALALVARDTAGDDVLPHGTAAPRTRDDMVECQIFRHVPLAAILAPQPVPCVDVDPAELDPDALALEAVRQADDGRHRPGTGRRT